MANGPASGSAQQTSHNNLAFARLAPAGTTLKVASPAFAGHATIPEMFSDYGQHVSPPLMWSGQPDTTKSFALILEDPDAKASAPQPFVHWVLYNVPGTTTQLPESLSATPVVNQLGGAMQGKNTKGMVGYFGPRPPAGDPPHHYHFEVFALDTTLSLAPGADKAALLAAMKNHVVGRGELIGTFQRK